MGDVRKALKMRREAQRRRALAPEYDLVRRDFDLGLADEMDREAQNGHSMKSTPSWVHTSEDDPAIRPP